MRRIHSLLLAFVLLCAALFPAAAGAQSKLARSILQEDCAPGEALVLYESSASSFLRSGMTSTDSPSAATDFGDSIHIQKNFDFSPNGLYDAAFLESETKQTNKGLSVALVSSAMDTQSLISYLDTLDFVRAAEPNYRIYPDSISNDPYVDIQWGLGGENGTHPEALWSSSLSPDEMIVAVIDTGIDYNNPDLANRIVDASLAYDAYPSSGILAGTDRGGTGHGTHVAGIIAAQTNNLAGVAGSAGLTDCKIMPVRVFADNGTGYAGDLVAGIHYVIEKKLQGKNIVAANMSLGGKWFSSEITSYALIALGEAGVLPVRSAGNNSLYIDDNSLYPSIYENPYTVCVAAIDSSGAFDSSYSNFSDTSVQIAAPGTDILSTYLSGKGGYVGRTGSVRFRDFEDESMYAFSYAPYHYQHGVISSDAVAFNVVPSLNGYNSAKSLRFNIAVKQGYHTFRILLPNSDGALSADQTLAFRLRFDSAKALPAYSIYADIGKGDTCPGMNTDYVCGKWYYFSANSKNAEELSLWVRVFDTDSLTVSIDDLGVCATANTAYHVFEGTSMAAPHATGAYALLCAAMPNASLSELRARLIGSSRTDASLQSRVVTGGSVDLRSAKSSDTGGFAPVIDKITQLGDTVTLEGWFFGDSPALTLAGKSITEFIQNGSNDACTLSFTLPSDIKDVQTLCLTKSNGRSYKMRYDYSPRGNMTLIGNMPKQNADVPILHDLFSYGNKLFYLISTSSGYAVCAYDTGNREYSPFSTRSSLGDGAARNDFSCFVDHGILYVYDVNHIHRYDMAKEAWLSDLDGPFALDLSTSGFSTGAVAVFEGQLMVIGGKGKNTSGKVYRYNYASGAWTEGESISSSFTPNSARAVKLGGRLIVFAQGYAWQSYVCQYDGQNWVSSSCSYADFYKYSFDVLGNEVLIFGDSEAENGILAYNPFQNAWRRLPYWGSGLCYSARGTVNAGRIYALTALQDFSERLLQYVDSSPSSTGGESSTLSDFDLELAAKRKKETEKIPLPPATSDRPVALIPFGCSLILFITSIKKRPRNTPQPPHGDQ